MTAIENAIQSYILNVDRIWNQEDSKTPFHWTPELLKLTRLLHLKKRFTLDGPATEQEQCDFLAIAAIMKWLINPYENVVLIARPASKTERCKLWRRIGFYLTRPNELLSGKIVKRGRRILISDPSISYPKDIEGRGIFIFPATSDKIKAFRGVKTGCGGSITAIIDGADEMGEDVINWIVDPVINNQNWQVIIKP